ncbi:MAG: hypothetical protein F6K28_54420 [Microcoleus sp. SIO2G3]|nr:hypothetical protein [Microcoleus sp. SIO2G3]
MPIAKDFTFFAVRRLALPLPLGRSPECGYFMRSLIKQPPLSKIQLD